MAASAPRPTPTARPDRDINHVLAYGQSLSNGYEGWPALSQAQPHDSLMLGDSVRPLRDDSPDWQPTGAAAFRPLRATVQDIFTGALLTPAEVAALPRGSIAVGETVLEGALNTWRGRQLVGGAVIGRQRLLASSCGTGGRTLEALSQGASPELFNRLRGCIALARQTAAAAGLSYGVTALLLLQGEHNNWGLDGGTRDTAAYAALLRRFYADAAALAGAAPPPAMFLYQTGGSYASPSQSVPQAQLDCALSLPGCYMVAPHYPVTEKGGHLDANGYRWLGAQFGKVLHRVLTLGEAWRPLHPLAAELAGQALLVRFHVPVPPLRWGRPLIGQAFGEPPRRGFSVVDGLGDVPIAGVELAGPDAVAISLGRAAAGAVTLRYADQTCGGRGALHDSDPDMAADCYDYAAGTGHYPEANLPELVGRPYPLFNWCVAFAVPVVPARPPPTRAWEILRDAPPPPPAAPPRTGLLAALRRLLGG